MPDVYNDSPVQVNRDTSSGFTSINAPDMTVIPEPLYQGAGAGKIPIDPYDAAFKSAIGSAYKDVISSPWAKSEPITQPAIQTPVNFALRYLKNWNKDIGFDVTDPNLEQKYGEEQGFWIRGLNRFLKTGATAAVSFAEGIESTVVNPLMGINSAVDSPTITSNDEWLQRLDSEDLPNFQTQYQKDNPNLSYFNPLHFTSWMDNLGNVTQNLGYTIGAIGAALVTDLPLALISAPLAEAPLLAAGAEGGLLARQASKIYSSIGKMARVLNSSEKEYSVYKDLINQGGSVLKALDKSANITEGFNIARFLTGVGVSAYSEAIVEGNNNYIDTRNSLRGRYQDAFGNYNGDDDTTSRIEEASKEAGKSTVAPNFGFLAVSNMIGLGTILRPAAAAIKATEEALAKEVALKVNPLNINNFEIVANQTKGIGGLFNRLTTPTSIFSDNLREAFEEGYQYVVSQANKDYYTRKFDAQSNQEAIDMGDSISKGINDLFSTTEGQQNMLLGFLGGALQHVGKSGVNRLRGISSLSGSALAADIQDKLQRGGSVTGLFNTTKDEAVTSVDINNDMQYALKKGDIFEYKNLQQQQLFNFVSSGVAANKFDLRIDQLNALKNLSKENFETLFNLDLNESTHKTVNDFVDGIIDKAKSIKSDIDKVNTVFGNNPFSAKKDAKNFTAFNAYKTELANAISQQKDYLRRSEQIKSNIFDTIPTASIENVLALSDEEGVQDTINRFEKRIEDLKNSEDLAKGNDSLISSYKGERAFLEQHVEDLKSNLKKINPDLYLKTVTSLYNYFINGENLKGNSNLNDLDVLGVYNNSVDVHRLNANTERIKRYYREMTGKDGFKNFAEDIARRITNYEDRVRFDDKGKMRILTDEELEAENKPTNDVTANKDYIKNHLDVASVVEGEDKIDKEDKELIAKLIDPDEKAEEGDISQAEKIRNGTVPITQEMKDIAKARLRAEFEDIKDNETENPDLSDVKPNATKAEIRAAKVKKAAEKQGVHIMDEDTDTGEDINDIMDKDLATKQAEAEAPSTTTTPVEEAPRPTEVTTNPFIRFWNKFIFNPLKEFNRIFSFNNEKNDVKYKTNLDRIVLANMTPELMHKNIISKVTIEVVKSTFGKSSDSQPSLMVYFDKGIKRFYDNLYRSGYDVDANIMIGGNQVGIMQPPSSIKFKRGTEFFTLDKLRDAAEYSAVTLNPANTFEQFKKDYNEYKSAYDEALKGFKSGEMLHLNNEQVLKLFKPVISYGSVDITSKAKDSTLIKDLKYRGKGDAILSFPIELNEQTGRYERTTTPNILNETDLTQDQLAETLEYIGGNIEKIHSQDVRYIYLMRMPDGKFSEQSILVARPEDENTVNLDGYLQQLKDALTNEDHASYFDINRELGEAVYIAHYRRTGNQVMRKTSARFALRRNEKKKKNSIILTIFNKGLNHNKAIEFSAEEINGLRNFTDLINLANDKITEAEKSDRYLQKIGLELTPESFKKSIPNDTDVSVEDLENRLKVSVRPKVFANTSITMMPANGEAYVAPPIVDGRRKRTTPIKTTGTETKTAGEVKTTEPAKVIGKVNHEENQKNIGVANTQVKGLVDKKRVTINQGDVTGETVKVDVVDDSDGASIIKGTMKTSTVRKYAKALEIVDTVPKAVSNIKVGQKYINPEGVEINVIKVSDKDGKTNIEVANKDKIELITNTDEFLKTHKIVSTEAAPSASTNTKTVTTTADQSKYADEIVNKNLNNIITQLKSKGLLKTDC